MEIENEVTIATHNGSQLKCYLLRPLTLERGCPTLDRQFQASAEQAAMAKTELKLPVGQGCIWQPRPNDGILEQHQ